MYIGFTLFNSINIQILLIYKFLYLILFFIPLFNSINIQILLIYKFLLHHIAMTEKLRSHTIMFLSIPIEMTFSHILSGEVSN